MYAVNADNISKINLSNGTVNQTWCTIPSSDNSSLANDRKYLYLSNFEENIISKIELSTGNVINPNWVSITAPSGMAIKYNYLYVTTIQNTLNKINLSDGSIIETISLGELTKTLGMCIHENFIYVLYTSNNTSRKLGKYTLNMVFVVIVTVIEDVYLLEIPVSMAVIQNYLYYVYYGDFTVINLSNGEYNYFPKPGSTLALTTDGINLWTSDNNKNVISFNGSGETPISNICFIKGTPVVTDQGIIEIQDITNENTINNVRVKYITQTTTNEYSLVCIEKDAICENIPSQTTILSENHKLLYNGQMVKAKNVTTSRIPYNGEILYNVLLEENGLMMVNNLICETLDINNVVALLYEHPNKNGIIKTLNGIKDNDVYKKIAIELLC